MKYTLIILFSFSAFAQINIIYDIDFTLTHEVPEGTAGSFKLAIDNKHYRVNDWALEGLEIMTNKENVKIHFFSGGGAPRNTEMLKTLKLPESKRSLFDIAENIYSYTDLEHVADDGHFTRKFKKNLGQMGFDLKKTIIIEDNAHFVPVSQKRNVLWIGKTYHHYDNFPASLASNLSGSNISQYAPDSFERWFLAKNKFKFVNELVLDALENVDEEDFLDYIHKEKNNYIPYNEHFDQNYKKIYGRRTVPNVCFRKFKYFKLL